MTHFTHGKINLYNMDCMELMRETPDKFYDLAICDPPYGAGQGFNFRFGKNVYVNNRPDSDYFKELFRVSKNQIVWGGNYFTNDLPESRGWLCWDKMQPADKFSDFELAWTSFDKVSSMFKYCNNGGFIAVGVNKKIHPTQKPVALYKWLLQNYAKAGDKIFDSHIGSGSIAIACHQMGFELTGTELDADYFQAMTKRVIEETKQQDLFAETAKCN